MTSTVLSVEPFGVMPDGRPVNRYCLRSQQLAVYVIPYGARIQSLRMLDASGVGARAVKDVVLGFRTLGEYLRPNPYIGAAIGRYANRIENARFELEGVPHRLVANEGPHCLHGGEGFDIRLWDVEAASSDAVVFSCISPDGEAGFPGELGVRVRFAVHENELRIDSLATTSSPTFINLTHHSYFNLSDSADVLGHELTIPAQSYLAVDEALIPMGSPQPVAGTPFDFQDPAPIGSRIREDHPQLRVGAGYDHCWVIDGGGRAARVQDPVSGRVMDVSSNQPGLQFYSGNRLDGAFERHAGFCLEPQHFPNSPNRADYPSTLLRPGTVYRSAIVYRFSKLRQ